MEVSSYNDEHSNFGGRAKCQCYQNSEILDDESGTSDDDDSNRCKKKRAKLKREQPMIVAVRTPLMARVHQNIQQAGEMVFSDATSSLDRLNSSLFIISMSSAAGGLPLGVMITSDEQEDTVRQGLQLLKNVVPVGAFYGRGGEQGPAIVMTDYSSAERNVLQSVWPEIKRLLCVFHFLQRNLTCLMNKIDNYDRKTVIWHVKSLVFAESDEKLLHLYSGFVNSDIGKIYPKYLTYVNTHWSRRKEWAVCYRKHLLVRAITRTIMQKLGFEF